jgi:FkbM family methyltransferase
MAESLYHKLVLLAENILPGSVANQLRVLVRRFRASVNAWNAKQNQARRLRRESGWDRQQGQGDFIIKLQPRVKIRLYYDSVICRLIYLDNFEAEERQFLNLFLRPGDVYVDIGANIGLFTLVAAHLTGSGGKVHAFEPCAKTFQRLQDNVRLNRFKNVQCHQMALSDSTKTMEFITSTDGNDAWNSFARPYIGGTFSSEPVAATTWDEWSRASQLTGRVTMVKIDVEGWEAKVLQGANQEFARPDAPLLQVEFTDDAAKSAGSSCQALHESLTRLGYEVCRFDATRRELVPDPVREKYPYCNLYAVKNRQLVQDRLNKPRTF